MSRKTVIWAIEQPGWASTNIFRQLSRYLGNKYDLRIMQGDQIPHGTKCDVLAVFWWPMFLDIAARVDAPRKYFGVYDHWSWRDRVEPFVDAWSESDGVWVANDAIGDALALLLGGNHPMWLLQDGVCHETFPIQPIPANTFRVGWMGNSNNGPPGSKGLEIIREACELANTEPLILDKKSGATIPHDRMAEEFYRNIMVYLCASETEGTANGVLEAAACGRPSITTRVGITEDLIIHGTNGFFVSRDVEEIARAIIYMRDHCNYESMGKWAHRASLRHSWERRALAFDRMFES